MTNCLTTRTPSCPTHGPMVEVEITQGKSKEDFIILGYAWFCMNDDENSPDYCDYCEDSDRQPPQTVKQIEMFD